MTTGKRKNHMPFPFALHVCIGGRVHTVVRRNVNEAAYCSNKLWRCVCIAGRLRYLLMFA